MIARVVKNASALTHVCGVNASDYLAATNTPPFAARIVVELLRVTQIPADPSTARTHESPRFFAFHFVASFSVHINPWIRSLSR